ncbi:MAG TPA: hypothetical protein VFK39_03725 [Gemmatimonadaceae bacterium]|nr:hypothetical protein [Gemmatimonadaceae bacterium]
MRRACRAGGSLTDRQLAVSGYGIPHKVTVSGTVDLPLRLSLSLVYVGRSGDISLVRDAAGGGGNVRQDLSRWRLQLGARYIF